MSVLYKYNVAILKKLHNFPINVTDIKLMQQETVIFHGQLIRT